MPEFPEGYVQAVVTVTTVDSVVMGRFTIGPDDVARTLHGTEQGIGQRVLEQLPGGVEFLQRKIV